MRLAQLSVLFALACGGEPQPAAPPPVPEGHEVLAGRAELPGDSIYQLQATLTDASGAQVPLDVHRGHPVLISMFYATCPSACPMLLSDLQAIEAQLTPEERAQVRVLLISLDPQTDTPAELTRLAQSRQLDLGRWTLASPTLEQVHDLSAVLGVTWKVMRPGVINHTSAITLLDAQGKPVARVDGLKQDAAPLLAALRGGG